MAGAVAGAALLYVIASGGGGFTGIGGFAANGFAEHSPGRYSLLSAGVTEVAMTFFFLVIILGATSSKAPAGFAPIAIGLGLTLIHLISIPVTNTSVNPARSTGPALFAEGGWALGQLWLFWAAPIAGGGAGRHRVARAGARGRAEARGDGAAPPRRPRHTSRFACARAVCAVTRPTSRGSIVTVRRPDGVARIPWCALRPPG